MHMLKEVCYMTVSFPVIHSSHDFTWALEVIHISRDLCLFHNTCCNHPLQQEVCGWFEKKLKGTFIWGKSLNPCSFKDAYLFHRTSSNNFCLKSPLLNGQKHIQRSHSFMMNEHSETTFIFFKNFETQCGVSEG